jgi:hypothetical protein
VVPLFLPARNHSKKKEGDPSTSLLKNSFCAGSANENDLCSQLPYYVTEKFQFGYTGILDSAFQPPFDVYSWQTFIALNWPADSTVIPCRGQSAAIQQHQGFGNIIMIRLLFLAMPMKNWSFA